MEVSRCLICYSSEIIAQSSSPSDLGCKGSAEASSLSNQSKCSEAVTIPVQAQEQLLSDLQVIFTLRNVLEVPVEELERHLVKWGSPSKWIKLCSRCNEAVGNARNIYQEILDASRILRAVKQEIVEMVKRSVARYSQQMDKLDCNRIGGEDAGNVNVIFEGGEEGIMEVTHQTRSFVEKHKYGIKSDPFLDGDSRAEKVVQAQLQDPRSVDEIGMEEEIILDEFRNEDVEKSEQVANCLLGGNLLDDEDTDMEAMKPVEVSMENKKSLEIDKGVTKLLADCIETQTPLVDMESSVMSIGMDLPVKPRDMESPAPPIELIDMDLPASPSNTDLTAAPSDMESPAPPIDMDSPAPPIDMDLIAAPSDMESPALTVAIGMKSVKSPTRLVEAESPTPIVDMKAPSPASLVDKELPAPLIDMGSTSPAPLSDMKSPVQLVDMESPTRPVSTESPTPFANTKPHAPLEAMEPPPQFDGVVVQSTRKKVEMEVCGPSNVDDVSIPIPENTDIDSKGVCEGDCYRDVSIVDPCLTKESQELQKDRTDINKDMKEDSIILPLPPPTIETKTETLLPSFKIEDMEKYAHEATEIMDADNTNPPHASADGKGIKPEINNGKSEARSPPSVPINESQSQQCAESKPMTKTISFNIPRFPIIKNVTIKEEKTESKAFIVPKISIISKVANKLKPPVLTEEISESMETKDAKDKDSSQVSRSPSSLRPNMTAGLERSSVGDSLNSLTSSQVVKMNHTTTSDEGVSQELNHLTTAPSSDIGSINTIIGPQPVTPPPETPNIFSDLDPFLEELLSLPPTIKPAPASRVAPVTLANAKINSLHGFMGHARDGSGALRHLCLCGRSYAFNNTLMQHIRNMRTMRMTLNSPTTGVPSQPNNNQSSQAEQIPKVKNGFHQLEKDMERLRKQNVEAAQDSGLKSNSSALASQYNGERNYPGPRASQQLNHVRQQLNSMCPPPPPHQQPQITARKYLTNLGRPLLTVKQLLAQKQRQVTSITSSRPSPRTNHSMKWYNCGQCINNRGEGTVQRFSGLADFTKHIHTVHGGWKCRRPNCERRFNTHLALQTHVLQQECSLEAFRISKAQVLKTAPVSISIRRLRRRRN